ncbi:MAG: hypothetical protein QS721_09170 [Candidatus Endonucleobacter sp. (ex Gigantidas childressi)]|nr:hypothetical protein [Candidatus Endonucleobacter sp. (ex Gigantidas childressi)]
MLSVRGLCPTPTEVMWLLAAIAYIGHRLIVGLWDLSRLSLTLAVKAKG